MPEPKYVIAMGAFTITGGMFSTDSYSIVRGVDKRIPVDVYLPGCPPKPEAIIDAITKLRKKISREIYEDPMSSQRENRCFTTNHKFHVLIPAIRIKDDSINHHLLQRYPLIHFSNLKKFSFLPRTKK